MAASINSTVSQKDEALALWNEFNAIAARMAGVEDILRNSIESAADAGNTLYLLADVVANMNEQICLASDRVRRLGGES